MSNCDQIPKQGQVLVQVTVGHLKNYIGNWRKITSVLGPLKLFRVITVNLHLLTNFLYLKSPRFSKNKLMLIEDEEEKLIRKGVICCVIAHSENELISNIFLVLKKTGDFHTVLNLKPLNQFMKQVHFKMENIQMTLNVISPITWSL